MCFPIWNFEPLVSGAVCTSWLPTIVPLVLPRSRRSTESSLISSAQCRRETTRSLVGTSDFHSRLLPSRPFSLPVSLTGKAFLASDCSNSELSIAE